MKLPIQAQPVERNVSTAKMSVSSIYPSDSCHSCITNCKKIPNSKLAIGCLIGACVPICGADYIKDFIRKFFDS